MSDNGAPPIVEVIIQFEKFGEDHVKVAPGVFMPEEEFLTEWQQIIVDYIEKKVREHYEGNTGPIV